MAAGWEELESERGYDLTADTRFCRCAVQLPRPKWMGPGLSSSTVTLNTPAGVFLRRFSLAFQGAYIVRCCRLSPF